MTEHHRVKAPKLAVVDSVKSPFMELEDDIFELHQMVQFAVMAAEHGDDGLTRFGVYQVEKLTEALKRRYYDLFEKHIGRQSA
jgi:hypothetical protein